MSQVSADVINLRILKQGDHLGLFRSSLNSTTSVLITNTQRRRQAWRSRGKLRRAGHVLGLMTSEFENYPRDPRSGVYVMEGAP